MAQAKESFPRSARLCRRWEFLALSRGGKRTHTPHFVVINKGNDKGQNRLGITVSSKVGKAVVRNRIKRLVREFFRRHRREFASEQDIVVIARRDAGDLTLDKVAAELSGALRYRDRRQRS